MEKQIIDLKLNVEGIDELSDKVDAAMKLLKEASAILNDVAQNATLNISVTPSEKK